MTTATEAQVTAPIQVGASKDFPAGRVTISVTHTHADTYRVVALELSGLSIPCWTRTFIDDAGDLPAGMTAKRAAWTYIQTIAADFGASIETPAQVVARVTADTEITAPARSRLTPAKIAAIASADPDGIIRVTGRAGQRTARSLARTDHLGTLFYGSQGLRRYVVGLRLNRDGLRLHAALTHQPVLAAWPEGGATK